MCQSWPRKPADLVDGPVAVKSGVGMEEAARRGIERFDFWQTLLRARLRLKDFAGAAEVPKAMRAWLEAHPRSPETPAHLAGFYSAWEDDIDRALGEVAEAEGRQADALAHYQRFLVRWRKLRPGDPVLIRAQALWKQLAGTDEGWLAWSNPVDAGAPAASAAPAPAAGWKSVAVSLADLHLSDFSGKTWTVADFAGKKTLVDVWASWCGPCTAELPHIQELYDQIKTQPDVQLITLNVDENPGMAEWLIRKSHFTFPVLLGESYFAAKALSVPRTWIVDPDGIARLEKINSNSPNGAPDFVADVLARLKPRPAKP